MGIEGASYEEVHVRGVTGLGNTFGVEFSLPAGLAVIVLVYVGRVADVHLDLEILGLFLLGPLPALPSGHLGSLFLSFPLGDGLRVIFLLSL